MIKELKTNITLQIPDHLIVMEKAEFEKLEEQADVTWVKGLEWLKEQTGIRSTITLREQLLYKYRKELEGACVTFPDRRGEHWYFNVVPMKKWLRQNFEKVAKS